MDELPGKRYVEKRIRNSIVPTMFVTHVRQAIRDCVTEKKQLPTLNMIQMYLKDLNLEYDWIYSRATLYRFMKRNGFEFSSPENYYAYTK